MSTQYLIARVRRQIQKQSTPNRSLTYSPKTRDRELSPDRVTKLTKQPIFENK